MSGVLLLAWSNFPVYSLVISEAGRPLGIDLGLAGGLALATPWVKNKSIKGLLPTTPQTSRQVRWAKLLSMKSAELAASISCKLFLVLNSVLSKQLYFLVLKSRNVMKYKFDH